MVASSRFVITAALLAALAFTVAGCSSNGKTLELPDRRADYRTSKVGNPLEVPPDLTASTIDDSLIVPELNPRASANLSDYQAERGGNERVIQESVLTQRAELRVRRDGERRWLYVEQEAPLLWERVKTFWTDGGFELTRADPRIGIMETNWLENRADIPDGPIRAVFKRFLDAAYSAPTRDRFRVRMEPSTDGDGSDVYLTHYGVEEIPTGRDGESLLWQQRERDPELEAEMLNRLMVHLGAEERRADAAAETDNPESTGPRSRYVDTADGYRALVIEEPYDRAWRLVGLALDGSDFVIEDQNRAEGLYLVGRSLLARNPKDSDGGFLSSLAFWGDDDELPPAGEDAPRHRIRLAGRGERTLVVIQDDQEKPDTSATAEQLLETVQNVIR